MAGRHPRLRLERLPGRGYGGAAAEAVAETDVQHAQRLEKAGGLETTGTAAVRSAGSSGRPAKMLANGFREDDRGGESGFTAVPG